MTELKYLDITKTAQGHITVPSVQKAAPSIMESIPSTPIASFSDGAENCPVEDLTVEINPVQSGSGDPSPSNVRPITGWTGMNVYRTGKNLLKYPYSETTHTTNTLVMTDNGDGTITANGTPSATTYFNFHTAAVPIFLKAGAYKIPATGNSNIQFNWYYSDATALSTGDVERTFTLTQDSYVYCFLRFSSGVQFSNVTINPMLLLATETNLTYEPFGTTYLTDWGINQWDEEWEVGGIDSSGATASADNRIRSTNYIPVLPNTSYYFKSPSGVYVWAYDANNNYIGRMGSGNLVTGSSTTPNECHYIKFVPNYPSYGTTYNNDISINYPASFTGYYKYADPNAGIVYGGTLNPVTGVLTVTHELVAISELSWTQHPNNTIVFYTTVSEKAFGTSNIMSDAFSVTGASVTSMIAGTMRGLANNTTVYIAANSTDPTDFINDYGTNQLLYELATPVTYNLTPTEVKTLLGENNIWAGTGNVAVDYFADTKLYINKVLNA